MDDLIIDGFKWVWSHSPTLVLGGLLVWAAMYLRSRFKKIEDKCEVLHTKDVPEINGKLNTIITQLSKVTTYLSTKFDAHNQLFQVNSPKELTSLGVDILDKIGGKKYIDNNISSLIATMEKQDFKSGLDVENYSTILLFEKTNEDGFTPIKNYIFQNPEYKLEDGSKMSLDINVVMSIMSIYLRNKYFEKYPDLKKDL